MPNLIADYSYLSTLSQCARKAYYAYEMQLAPAEGGKSVALHVGSVLHVGLDWLATHNWDIDGALAAAEKAWGDFTLPPTHKHAYAGHFGHIEVILRNYVDDRKGGDDRVPVRLRPDDLRTTMLPEGFSFAVDDDGYIKLVETPLAIQWSPGMVYGGKIDDPNVTAGSYALWDRKTTRQWLSESWAQKYANSHQMRGYIAILRALTGMPFDRVYIDGVYTGKEAADDDAKWDKRTTRRSALFGPYIYSEQLLEETRDWAERWMSLAQMFREAAASGAGEAAWPQNDRACFNYGEECTFYALCARSPHIRPALIKQLYTIRPFTGVLASGADSDD